MTEPNESAKEEAIKIPDVLPVLPLKDLVIFPFINGPVIKKIGKLNERQFNKLMQERKRLIPIWLKAMLKAK